MAHRIDPRVQNVQSASLYSTVDCAFAKADLEELRPRHDAVLAFRETSNLSISHASLHRPSVCGGRCRLACLVVWHAASMGLAGARVVR
jgi:hypothetical protein